MLTLLRLEYWDNKQSFCNKDLIRVNNNKHISFILFAETRGEK